MFLTTDQGIPYQQNLTKLDLSLIIPTAISNDTDDLLLLVPSISGAILMAIPGKLLHLEK